MTHKWYPASGGGLLGTLWTGNPLKVALLKSTYVPDYDLHKVWADISANEITGTGYTAGGQLLATKSVSYDPAGDRNNLVAADSSWGPGATFQAAFAVIYDSSGAMPIWSLVDFQGVKDVTDGIFTIDWATVGLLYTVPV
jgi:hypothetical protein